MEIIVANVDHIKFDIDYALEEQFGALPLPFPGMDKSTAAVCEFYTQLGDCTNGPQCPYRHVRGDRTVVCKHWLRGLCKKGDQCEFLHEYDMSKMPECYFYARFNACHNKECPFLHIDPESKIKDCPWYDRGFCRHGPQCRHRHVRRVLCCNYLAGFCTEGSACKYMHPRFELPAPPDQKGDCKRTLPLCHYCQGIGHKAITCHKMPPDQREAAQRQEDNRLRSLGVASRGGGAADAEQAGAGAAAPHGGGSMSHPPRMQRLMHKPLEEVTCFKCGNKGHYANKCPKGHLAFLSNQAQNHQPHNNHHQQFNNQNQQFNNQNHHFNNQHQPPNQNQPFNNQNHQFNNQNQSPNQNQPFNNQNQNNNQNQQNNVFKKPA